MKHKLAYLAMLAFAFSLTSCGGSCSIQKDSSQDRDRDQNQERQYEEDDDTCETEVDRNAKERNPSSVKEGFSVENQEKKLEQKVSALVAEQEKALSHRELETR